MAKNNWGKAIAGGVILSAIVAGGIALYKKFKSGVNSFEDEFDDFEEDFDEDFDKDDLGSESEEESGEAKREYVSLNLDTKTPSEESASSDTVSEEPVSEEEKTTEE